MVVDAAGDTQETGLVRGFGDGRGGAIETTIFTMSVAQPWTGRCVPLRSTGRARSRPRGPRSVLRRAPAGRSASCRRRGRTRPAPLRTGWRRCRTSTAADQHAAGVTLHPVEQQRDRLRGRGDDHAGVSCRAASLSAAPGPDPQSMSRARRVISRSRRARHRRGPGRGRCPSHYPADRVDAGERLAVRSQRSAAFVGEGEAALIERHARQRNCRIADRAEYEPALHRLHLFVRRPRPQRAVLSSQNLVTPHVDRIRPAGPADLHRRAEEAEHDRPPTEQALAAVRGLTWAASASSPMVGRRPSWSR